MSGPADQPGVEVVVTVAEDHLQRFRQLASELEGKGLKINNMMEGLGIISGAASLADVQQLKGMKGVKSVEEAGNVQLPPPESDIQ
ncbi:hypothetical protein AB3X96_42230 [Paraburkholderia sp. BR13439]|uniref:Ketohydroxyglutarate aldolase n=1 Tax=Paraburkholderia youngii TaxID=2782701 RepID=A0A7Y6N4J4_9BURK|nr:hypothetical protein [Paraburkholderia youngii]NUY05569.1 hypothetical protein [Paraburkholderia youngii]